MEYQHHLEEEPNDENEVTSIVDLEAEIIAALNEIESLRDINNK